MNQEIITKFDYSELDTEIRISLKSRAEKIGERTRKIASNIWENGREFHEAQQELAAYGSGSFQAWIEAETGFSVRMAYRFIDVYRRVDYAKLAQSNIAASALYLIAAPSTPEEARQEVIEVAAQGEPVTYSRAKTVIESHKEPSPADIAAGLRRACHNMTGAADRWQKRRDSGLDDEGIKRALQYEFGLGGSSSGPGIAAICYKGGADPRFWYGTFVQDEKPTLRGKALFTAVRELFDIPMPRADYVPAADQNAIITANNEEFFRRYEQETIQHREDMADPDGRKPPSKCPRCHASKSSVLIGSDHWQCRNCNREYDNKGKMPVETADPEYTYTAEIEQYVEAVDAGGPPVGNLMADRIKAANEPRQLTIGELETPIYGWLTIEFGHSNLTEWRDALLVVKETGNRLDEIAAHIINRAYANTEPRPEYRANDLKQAIGNVCEQLRQRLEERERNAVILSRDQAIGELKVYLENTERELKRIAEKHQGIELVGNMVTAVRSYINLSVAELRRATRHDGSEEE